MSNTLLYRATIMAFLSCFCLISVNLSSAQQFRWPDEPENIKVLPDSITGEKLGEVMRGYSMALGVRCSHCHVGQGPLSEYDFASDDKPEKEKTRIMMRMTDAINQEYVSEFADVEEEPVERVSVTCLTCHRNVAKPMLLENVLAQTYEEGGVEEVFAHYDELRDAFYGGFAYDFREGVLTRLGQNLANEGNLDNALKILEKEIELHDDYADVYRVQGAILEEMSKINEAIASYEKGKALSTPRGSRFFQQQIDRLKEQNK